MVRLTIDGNEVEVPAGTTILKAAEEAGKLLGERLTKDYDRGQVTAKMQKKMMDLFAEST